MRFVVMVSSTIGSAAGWWLGQRAGIFTAFVLSMVGLGVGLWAGRRLAHHWSLD